MCVTIMSHKNEWLIDEFKGDIKVLVLVFIKVYKFDISIGGNFKLIRFSNLVVTLPPVPNPGKTGDFFHHIPRGEDFPELLAPTQEIPTLPGVGT